MATAIVVAGQLISNIDFLIETLLPFKNHTVISTWTTANADHVQKLQMEGFHVLKNTLPDIYDISASVRTFGQTQKCYITPSMNHQAYTVLEGLAWAEKRGYTSVLKTRTDFFTRDLATVVSVFQATMTATNLVFLRWDCVSHETAVPQDFVLYGTLLEVRAYYNILVPNTVPCSDYNMFMELYLKHKYFGNYLTKVCLIDFPDIAQKLLKKNVAVYWMKGLDLQNIYQIEDIPINILCA